MVIKSTLQPDFIQVNKYELFVVGLPLLTFTKIGGIEEELDNPDLPDRTTHTGGRTKPVEFECELPMHHELEQRGMELWFEECKDPVSPTHKKVGTLTFFSQSLLRQVSFSIRGMFPQKRSTPDLDLDNDGEMAVVTWTFKADELIKLQ